MSTPEPLDRAVTYELKKEFARSLGFDPNEVTGIEFTATFIKVRCRGHITHVLTTGATAWTTLHPAGYGHAQEINELRKSESDDPSA